VTWVKWKLVSICLQIVLISVQGRCTICVEYTMGMEILLATPDRLLGDMGQIEAHFGLFRDSVNPDAR
jgi:hypothetical protein